MQFLIFVKINSKSLAPCGMWPPWQSYVSAASSPCHRPPSSFEPHPMFCPQSLVTVPKLPSGLSLCLVAPSLAEPTLSRRCCAWAGALFQAHLWPTLRLQSRLPSPVRISLVRSDAGSLQTAQKVRVLQTAPGECLRWPFAATWGGE